MEKKINCGTFTIEVFTKQTSDKRWTVRLKVERPDLDSTIVLEEVTNELAAEAEVTRIVSCFQTGSNPVSIDAAAHALYDFDASKASGRTRIGEHVAFYHENRLYSVRNTESNVLSLVTASNPYKAIEAISGACNEPPAYSQGTQEHSEGDSEEYSALELAAYEQYKREWCAVRGCTPDEVDFETGINGGPYGGQSFVCIEEFLNLEFADTEQFDYFRRFYSLNRLLEWVGEKFGLTISNLCYKFGLSLIEGRLIVGEPTISTLKGWLNVPFVERKMWLHETLRKVFSFVLEVDPFVDIEYEFVVKLGLDIELIQRYIEIPGVMTEKEFAVAQEQLFQRGKRQGALVAISLHDAGHLSPIWYKRKPPFASFTYKGCSACYYVEGDAEVFFEGKRVSDGDFKAVLKNDAYLHACERAGRVTFRVRPWVVIEFRDESNRIIDLKTTRSDCLAAIESTITGFFAAIDAYTEKEDK